MLILIAHTLESLTMITPTRALLLASIALTGCQDYLFEQKFPEKVKEAQIITPAGEPTPADILFVVDNSGSMADEQEILAANFDAFINQIAGAGNYQIGIVTTDLDSQNGELEGLAISTFSPNFPNHLTGFDAGMCRQVNIGHGCFRGADPAKRIISSERMAKEEQIAVFRDTVKVGSCGHGSEKGLDATIRALEQSRNGGCNEGFLRGDANLVVIILSDENDAGQAPVEQFVNDIAQFKPYASLRVAMIVSSVNGEGVNCRIPNTNQCGSLCNRRNEFPPGSGNACGQGNPCQSGEYCKVAQGQTTGICENEVLRNWNDCDWCSFYNTEDCCSARDGDRYVDAARRIEGRVNASNPLIPISGCRAEPGTRAACFVDSICQDNFSETLTRIARELVLTNEFNLDPPAINPSGVVVKVKGGRFGAEGITLQYGVDFTVSADGRVLSIMGEKTPQEGETVEIFFVIET